MFDFAFARDHFAKSLNGEKGKMEGELTTLDRVERFISSVSSSETGGEPIRGRRELAIEDARLEKDDRSCDICASDRDVYGKSRQPSLSILQILMAQTAKA